MLVELMQELGISPKKTSATEFHSSCPNCQGKDRFVIWPQTERFWCRRCGKSGDLIQFCRDFFQLDFKDACIKAKKEPNISFSEKPVYQQPADPPLLWKESAEKFVNSSYLRLLDDSSTLALLRTQRGLLTETIHENKIGWNPIKTFYTRESWGLGKYIKSGKEQKLFVPSGIVIPTYVNSVLQKVKIRRSDWQMGAVFQKYHIVAGSNDHVSIFGKTSNPFAVIVEAELDALLIAQEVGNQFCSVALGGATKRPDLITHQWLRSKELILFCLDFDPAGKQAYAYWKQTYPNLKPWPTPFEKGPGDAFQKGLDLKEWLEYAIS